MCSHDVSTALRRVTHTNVLKLEALELDNEYLRQFPYRQRVGGLHVLLTLVAVPRVLAAEHLWLDKLLQAVRQLHMLRLCLLGCRHSAAHPNIQPQPECHTVLPRHSIPHSKPSPLVLAALDGLGKVIVCTPGTKPVHNKDAQVRGSTQALQTAARPHKRTRERSTHTMPRGCTRRRTSSSASSVSSQEIGCEGRLTDLSTPNCKRKYHTNHNQTVRSSLQLGRHDSVCASPTSRTGKLSPLTSTLA